MTSRYDEIYARSIADPEGFWAEAASALHWTRKWDKVLDASRAAHPHPCTARAAHRLAVHRAGNAA